MNRTIIATAFLLTGLLQTTHAAADAAPLIQYSWSGGLSNLKTVDVCVQSNGQVAVKYVKQTQKPVEYGFTLDRDEVAALAALVGTVKFFDQATNDTAIVLDVGESSLTITVGKNQRTLRSSCRPELEPLTEVLWKLIQQGIVTTELQTKGDTYQAMRASCGALLYSPRLLVEPLKKEIVRSQDRQKLEWGLTGLTWLLTEDQWLDFVSSQLADAGAARKTLLLGILGSHPFYDKIPESHARILLPVLTSIVDSFAATKDRIEPRSDEALGIVCQFLGAKKYDRCLPALSRLKQVHGDSVAGGWAGWAMESINAGKRKPQPTAGGDGKPAPQP